VTSKPDLTQLVPRADGRFEEMPFEQAQPAPIVLVNLEGDLYFAAVEDLDYELQRALTPTTRVVVLRMKRLRAVGSTAMAILERFHAMLQTRGVSLVVCGIEPDLQRLMVRSGLRDRIEEPNIFYADNTIFRSTELAMARARNILEMERWRTEPAGPAQQTGTPAMTARDVMSRQCIRFGEGHSLREAVWLLSEMNRRQKTMEPQPLFLQDRDGKLSGMLSPWKLLREMMADLSADDAIALSDRDLGRRFAAQFNKPIGPMSRQDLPEATLDTSFISMFHMSLLHSLSVLPIRDNESRVVGLVGQHDLLEGLGKLMSAAPPAPAQRSPAEE
jgi:sulfate permease, SulP family